MKRLVKGFQQFVNEGQSPAHQLYRKAAAYTSPGEWSKEQGAEFTADYAKLKATDPAEADRFGKLATRLKGHRELSRKKEILTRNPEILARYIGDQFVYNGDTWPAKLAHEFSNGNMSIEQLKSKMVELSGLKPEIGELYADQVINAVIRADRR